MKQAENGKTNRLKMKKKPYKEHLGFKGSLRELWKNKLLYLMMVPTIIWVLIFCYYPMYASLSSGSAIRKVFGEAPGWD